MEVRRTAGARRRAVTAVAALCALAGLAACSEERDPSNDEPTPLPTSDEGLQGLTLPKDAPLLIATDLQSGQPRQVGQAAVEVEVQSLDGGSVRAVPGLNGKPALEFPSFVASGTYPRAVVTATPQGSDTLSPGEDDFRFGADFKLVDPSTGRREDNGNNIVQRGLSSSDVLYKLEVDRNRRPACTVKGDEGLLTTYARKPIVDSTWYRVVCEREGDALRVFVSEYLSSGNTITTGRETRGPMGALVYENPEVPFSMGGKVAREGSIIVSSTDQFNGEITNAYFALGAGTEQPQ